MYDAGRRGRAQYGAGSGCQNSGSSSHDRRAHWLFVVLRSPQAIFSLDRPGPQDGGEGQISLCCGQQRLRIRPAKFTDCGPGCIPTKHRRPGCYSRRSALALSTLLTGPALALIPTLVVLFAIGRVTFPLCYPEAAGGRAFGIAMTAIPTVELIC